MKAELPFMKTFADLTDEQLNRRFWELHRDDIYPTCKYSGCEHKNDPPMPLLHTDMRLALVELNNLEDLLKDHDAHWFKEIKRRVAAEQEIERLKSGGRSGNEG